MDYSELALGRKGDWIRNDEVRTAAKSNTRDDEAYKRRKKKKRRGEEGSAEKKRDSISSAMTRLIAPGSVPLGPIYYRH